MGVREQIDRTHPSAIEFSTANSLRTVCCFVKSAMHMLRSPIGAVLLLAMFCPNVSHVAYGKTDIEEGTQCTSHDSDDGIDCLLRLALKNKLTPFRRLAQDGNPNYQYLLGRAYQGGDVGVQQDYAEAVRWYRKAAIQGNGMAQMALGMMYFEGQGVTRSYETAFTWLKPAAEQGEPLAQVSLGTMYEAGDVVPRDFIQAYMWFSLAADSISDTHERSVAGPREVATMARQLIAERMASDQIAEAQKMAREWRPKKVRSRLADHWFEEMK